MFLQLCCKVSGPAPRQDHNLFIWMIQASRTLDVNYAHRARRSEFDIAQCPRGLMHINASGSIDANLLARRLVVRKGMSRMERQIFRPI